MSPFLFLPNSLFINRAIVTRCYAVWTKDNDTKFTTKRNIAEHRVISKEKKCFFPFTNIELEVAGSFVMEAMTLSIWNLFRENLRQSIWVDNSTNPLPVYSRDVGRMSFGTAGHLVLRPHICTRSFLTERYLRALPKNVLNSFIYLNGSKVHLLQG